MVNPEQPSDDPTMSQSRPDSPARPPATGGGDATAFPGFDLKGEIGRGGMGAVYLARELDAHRDIALKTVKSDGGTGHPRRLDRFIEEAYVTAQLQHPGIVPVYRIVHDDCGHSYYTMRPIEGQTLAAILEKLRQGDRATADQFPLRRLVQIFYSVCQTMRFAHDRGVIHRDLKPSNIVVGDYGEVLVIDWGLAKVIGPPSSASEGPVDGAGTSADIWSRYQRNVESLRAGHDSDIQFTQDGTFLGTPAYVSPEQTAGHAGGLDARSDVWSLGVILFELCTLKLPFAGLTAREMIENVKTTDPRDPMRVDPKRPVPPELAEIILRCLKRDRAARYSSVGELAQQVSDWLDGVAPWKLVADYDFTKMPDGPVEGWTAWHGGDPMWVKDGMLTWKGKGLFLQDKPVIGDVQTEVEAMLVTAPDRTDGITLTLNTPTLRRPRLGQPDIGYYFCFETTGSRIMKFTADVTLATSQQEACAPGQWYRMTAERVGGVLRLYVDGKELLSYRDYSPLSGQYVGMEDNQHLINVRRFRVWSRGVPRTPSCLEIPRVLYREGLFGKARDECLRIVESHPVTQEACEALDLAGRSSIELASRASDAAERQRMIAEAGETFHRLEQTHLAPLGCMGMSLICKLRGDLRQEAVELDRAYLDHPGYRDISRVTERLWERAIELVRDVRGGPFFRIAARRDPAGLLVPARWRRCSYMPDVDVDVASELRSLVATRFGAVDWLNARAEQTVAQALRRAGRYEDALVVYRGIATNFADVPNRMHRLGRMGEVGKVGIGEALAMMGRHEEALECWEGMLAATPKESSDNWATLTPMGHLLLLQGEQERTASIYEQLSPLWLYRQGVGVFPFLVGQGLYDEALKQLESVSDDALLADCWVAAYVGDVLRWMGRHDDGVAAYERVLADFPYCGYPAGWALAGIAMIHLARGDRPAVRQALDRAAKTGWCQWAFRAATNSHDEEALRSLEKNGGGRYLYDVACCLDAYARGDDASAMGHANRLAKQWHWEKELLWRDGKELQKLLSGGRGS